MRSVLIDTKEILVVPGAHRVGFEWDDVGFRYLTVDGERRVEVANACGTCRFWFARETEQTGPVEVTALASRLNGGLEELDDEVLDAFGPLLAPGRYTAALVDMQPELVVPGGARDYFVEDAPPTWGVPAEATEAVPYWRGTTAPLSGSATFYELVVPLVDIDDLHGPMIDRYSDALTTGTRPTAVAIAVLDARGPAQLQLDGGAVEHWLLAHHLLDGHHKVAAAAETGRAIRLLTLLDHRASLATDDERQRVLELLAEPEREPGT